MVLLLFAIFSLSNGQYMPDEVVVKFRAGVTEATINALNSEFSTSIFYISPYLGFRRIKIPKGRTVEEMVNRYRQNPNVEYAEPNAIMQAFWTPNDPFFSYQWHFDAAHLNMPAAWDIEQGGNSSVVVAVVDAGVAYEDYAIPSYELSEVYSRDGYYHQAPDLANTNFVTGYDFINDDSHPNDENCHGTHVTGTIAQSTNNGSGCAGMAFRCSIMPVRVLNNEGSGSNTAVADGISFAVQHGADVINMSLGGPPGDSSGTWTMHQAIIDAVNRGVVVVAATGNNNTNKISYPGGFSECIAVGATEYLNQRAPYSNWGPGIDIVAPGGDVSAYHNAGDPDGVLQQTFRFPNDGTNVAQVDSFAYMYFQGTSMANPHVSGLVALMIAHGITGVANIKNILYSTATDLGASNYDEVYGYGLIDPVAALSQSPGELTLAVPILQNPYLDQYADIWVAPSKGLQNPPVVGVKIGSESTAVLMNPVSGCAAYQGDYEFTESGTATVFVTADGTDTSRTFSVSLVGAGEGGVVMDPGQKAKLEVLPNALSRNTYLTVIADTTGTAFAFGPSGLALKNPGLLSFSYDEKDLRGASVKKMGIYCYENGNWQYRGGLIDSKRRVVVLPINKLGNYVLRLDPSGPDATIIPTQPVLAQNTPNPFRQGTAIRFQVPLTEAVTLRIYDALGRQVRSLVDGQLPLGEYEVTWDGKGERGERLSAGMYFYRLVTENSTIMKKLVLLP
jgi:serine protease